MQHRRHWTFTEKSITTSDGVPLHVRAWGGGDTPESAFSAAQIEMARLEGKAAKGADAFWNRDYAYPERATREEILERIDQSNLVSWSKYGAAILNSENLMIVDIDTPADGFWKQALNWFLNETASPEERAWNRISAWSFEHPEVALRVYRTKAGWRVLLVDRPRGPDNPQHLAWMKEMRGDPLYIRLCRIQRCFRARLGPKPWRIGLASLNSWIHDRSGPEERARIMVWRQEYAHRSRQWRVCDQARLIGAERMDPELTDLVAYHDWACGCHEKGLPLA